MVTSIFDLAICPSPDQLCEICYGVLSTEDNNTLIPGMGCTGSYIIYRCVAFQQLEICEIRDPGESYDGDAHAIRLTFIIAN